MVKASAMDDERDREIKRLQLMLKWAQEDNARLQKLVDDAVAQLREANQRNARLHQERVDEAHARTLECEQRLARAVLDARTPDTKLH
jgi:hypothetical protein